MLKRKCIFLFVILLITSITAQSLASSHTVEKISINGLGDDYVLDNSG